MWASVSHALVLLAGLLLGQANPRLHAEVLLRVLQSPFVVDQERIAGALSVPGGPECQPLTAVVVYELKDGSIARAWIVR
jgi:hypothetical protein